MPIEFSTPRRRCSRLAVMPLTHFDASQAAGAQMVDALEQAVGDDRLEGVELQLTGLGGKADGDIVADHLERDLVDDFGYDRVDLARHDAASGLHRRQVDLAQADARAG